MMEVALGEGVSCIYALHFSQKDLSHARQGPGRKGGFFFVMDEKRPCFGSKSEVYWTTCNSFLRKAALRERNWFEGTSATGEISVSTM